MAGGDRERGPARPSGALTTIGAPGRGSGDVVAPPVPVGTVLAGRYRLLEALGRGGMGVVYRARDTVLDAEVAVKLLDPGVAGDADRAAAFRNEVRVARKVTHPRVCRLHDLVEADGHWLITMQYVDGESLADRLRREMVVSVPGTIRILGDVAEGLAAAHAAGVVHRDLKPANVLLAVEDGRAVVADFGIAADARAGTPVDVAGTRGYMAPEQAAGGAVDARSDVYAFGVLAHRMLTGELPWNAPTRVESTDVSVAAASAPPDAPPALLALIDECLAAAPADWPADGAALVARLRTPGALAAAAAPARPRSGARGDAIEDAGSRPRAVTGATPSTGPTGVEGDSSRRAAAGRGGPVGRDTSDDHASGDHASDRHAFDRDASDRHASGDHASGDHASRCDAFDRHASGDHASGDHASDRDAFDRDASDRHVSGDHASGDHASHRDASDRHASDRHVSGDHASDRDAFDRDASDRHSWGSNATDRRASVGLVREAHDLGVQNRETHGLDAHGRETNRHDPADLGVLHRGPADRGALDRGPADRGALGRGPADRGVPDRDPARRGALDRDPAGRGALDRAPADRGALHRDPADRGALDVDTADRGALDRTPADRGPLDRGPAGRRPLDRTPAARGALHRDTADRGALDRAPAGRGVLDRDPAGRGALDRGPADRGALDRDPADRGALHRDPADRGALDVDTADRGALDVDPADRGALDRDPADRGVPDRDTANRGALDRDPADRGAPDRDPADRGALDVDPASRGALDRDTASRGALDVDTADRGAPRGASATPTRRWRRVGAVLGGGALVAAAVAGIAVAAGWRPWSAPIAAAPAVEEIAIDVALDPSASAEDGTTRDGLARLVAEELDDAWGIRARPIGAAEKGRPGTARVAARLWLGPDRRLVVEASIDRGGTGQGQGWEPEEEPREGSTRIEGTGVRLVARDLAAWAARAAMPAPLHPWPDELARVCARSAEAWRLWQRARRESRMQRWSQARELSERAMAIDPSFPLAPLELSFTYTGQDPALVKALERASSLASACPTLGAEWRLTFEAIRVGAGSTAASRPVVERLLALPELGARERLYFQTRWAFALWFNGDRDQGEPLLEWIAEEWPTDASAPKLLAHIHLEGDGPADAAEALRYARQAVAAAPYDVGCRADLARALLAGGDRPGAEAEARRLDRAEPVEKQGALAGSENENSLVSLRLELGQWADAERDARRLLLGPVTERSQGRAALAALDALDGRFASSVDQMIEASRECREAGIDTTASVHMWKAAWLAYQSGAWDRAATLFRSLESDTRRGRTDVFLSLVEAQRGPASARARNLGRARAAALALPAGSTTRMVLEMLVAHASREWTRVIELDGALREAGFTGALVPALLAADALAGVGELRAAEARLVTLATHPRAWKEPIAAVRAWRRLGEVRERLGDRAGAAEAYRALISRWTRAPAGQEDVVAARAGLERLGAR